MYLRKCVVVFSVLFLFAGMTASVNGAKVSEEKSLLQPVAEVVMSSSIVYFQPKRSFSSVELRISRPDGSGFMRTFRGESPYFDLSGDLLEGTYTYELRASTMASGKVRVMEHDGERGEIPTKSSAVNQLSFVAESESC